MNKSISVLAITALLGLTACEKKPVETPPPSGGTQNEVHFNIDNHFGSSELELETGTYTTAQNEEIKISIFNYWVTNIVLVREDGTEFAEPESYRLIRGDKSNTHHFHVANVPAGTYKAIKFMVGVDVPRNTSGAQTGALDPAVSGDMFWTWNTGYIQAKLEGTSPQSTELNNAVTYHIGGVKAGEETPRNVSINFPQNMVVGEKAGSIKIKTDAAMWFGPTYPLTIADNAFVMSGGATASAMADNLPAMFSVTSVGNE